MVPPAGVKGTGAQAQGRPDPSSIMGSASRREGGMQLHKGGTVSIFEHLWNFFLIALIFSVK